MQRDLFSTEELFSSTESAQICHFCHCEIRPGANFVKESTQMAGLGKLLFEQGHVRIYHKLCFVCQGNQ